MSSSSDVEINVRFDISAICKRCAAVDHCSKECRNERVFFCWICGRKNTRTTACCSTATEQSSSGSTKGIPYPKEPLHFDSEKGLCATVGFGYELVLAKIDTSSFRSYVGELYANELGTSSNISIANVFVKLQDGSEKLFKEELRTLMKFGNWQGYMNFLIDADLKGYIVLGLDFLALTNSKLTTCGVSVALNVTEIVGDHKSAEGKTKRKLKSVASCTSPTPMLTVEHRDIVDQKQRRPPPNVGPLGHRPNANASSVPHVGYQTSVAIEMPAGLSAAKTRTDPSFERHKLKRHEWPPEIKALIRQRQECHRADPKNKMKITHVLNGVSYRIILAKNTSFASVRILGPLIPTPSEDNVLPGNSSMVEQSLLSNPYVSVQKQPSNFVPTTPQMREQRFKRVFDPTFVRYYVAPADWCAELKSFIKQARIELAEEPPMRKSKRFSKVFNGICYKININKTNEFVRCAGPVTFVPISNETDDENSTLASTTPSADSTQCIDMDVETDNDEQTIDEKSKDKSADVKQSKEASVANEPKAMFLDLAMEDISSDEEDYTAGNDEIIELSSISSDTEIEAPNNDKGLALKVTSKTSSKKRKRSKDEVESLAQPTKFSRLKNSSQGFDANEKEKLTDKTAVMTATMQKKMSGNKDKEQSSEVCSHKELSTNDNKTKVPYLSAEHLANKTLLSSKHKKQQHYTSVGREEIGNKLGLGSFGNKSVKQNLQKEKLVVDSTINRFEKKESKTSFIGKKISTTAEVAVVETVINEITNEHCAKNQSQVKKMSIVQENVNSETIASCIDSRNLETAHQNTSNIAKRASKSQCEEEETIRRDKIAIESSFKLGHASENSKASKNQEQTPEEVSVNQEKVADKPSLTPDDKSQNFRKSIDQEKTADKRSLTLDDKSKISGKFVHQETTADKKSSTLDDKSGNSKKSIDQEAVEATIATGDGIKSLEKVISVSMLGKSIRQEITANEGAIHSGDQNENNNSFTNQKKKAVDPTCVSGDENGNLEKDINQVSSADSSLLALHDEIEVLMRSIHEEMTAYETTIKGENSENSFDQEGTAVETTSFLADDNKNSKNSIHQQKTAGRSSITLAGESEHFENSFDQEETAVGTKMVTENMSENLAGDINHVILTDRPSSVLRDEAEVLMKSMREQMTANDPKAKSKDPKNSLNQRKTAVGKTTPLTNESKNSKSSINQEKSVQMSTMALDDENENLKNSFEENTAVGTTIVPGDVSENLERSTNANISADSPSSVLRDEVEILIKSIHEEMTAFEATRNLDDKSEHFYNSIHQEERVDVSSNALRNESENLDRDGKQAKTVDAIPDEIERIYKENTTEASSFTTGDESENSKNIVVVATTSLADENNDSENSIAQVKSIEVPLTALGNENESIKNYIDQEKAASKTMACLVDENNKLKISVNKENATDVPSNALGDGNENMQNFIDQGKAAVGPTTSIVDDNEKSEISINKENAVDVLSIALGDEDKNMQKSIDQEKVAIKVTTLLTDDNKKSKNSNNQEIAADVPSIALGDKSDHLKNSIEREKTPVETSTSFADQEKTTDGSSTMSTMRETESTDQDRAKSQRQIQEGQAMLTIGVEQAKTSIVETQLSVSLAKDDIASTANVPFIASKQNQKLKDEKTSNPSQSEGVYEAENLQPAANSTCVNDVNTLNDVSHLPTSLSHLSTAKESVTAAKISSKRKNEASNVKFQTPSKRIRLEKTASAHSSVATEIVNAPKLDYADSNLALEQNNSEDSDCQLVIDEPPPIEIICISDDDDEENGNLNSDSSDMCIRIEMPPEKYTPEIRECIKEMRRSKAKLGDKRTLKILNDKTCLVEVPKRGPVRVFLMQSLKEESKKISAVKTPEKAIALPKRKDTNTGCNSSKKLTKKRLITAEEQPAQLKELLFDIRKNWSGLVKEKCFMRVFDGIAYSVKLHKEKGEEVHAWKWSDSKLSKQKNEPCDNDNQATTSKAIHSSTNAINSSPPNSKQQTVQTPLALSEITEEICNCVQMPEASARKFRKKIENAIYAFKFNRACTILYISRLQYVEQKEETYCPILSEFRGIAVKELKYQLLRKEKIPLWQVKNNILSKIKGMKKCFFNTYAVARYVDQETVYLITKNRANTHIEVSRLIFDEEQKADINELNIEEPKEMENVPETVPVWPFKSTPEAEVPMGLKEIPLRLKSIIEMKRKSSKGKETTFRQAIDGVGYAVRIFSSGKMVQVQRLIFPAASTKTAATSSKLAVTVEEALKVVPLTTNKAVNQVEEDMELPNEPIASQITDASTAEKSSTNVDETDKTPSIENASNNSDNIGCDNTNKNDKDMLTIIMLEKNGEIFRIALEDPMFWAKYYHLVQKKAIAIGDEPEQLKSIIKKYRRRVKRNPISFRHAVEGQFYSIAVNKRNNSRICLLEFTGTIISVSKEKKNQTEKMNPNKETDQDSLNLQQNVHPSTFVTVEYNGEVFHIQLDDEGFWFKWKHLVRKVDLSADEETEDLTKAIDDYRQRAQFKDASFQLVLNGNFYTIKIDKNGCVQKSRLLFVCEVLNVSTRNQHAPCASLQDSVVNKATTNNAALNVEPTTSITAALSGENNTEAENDLIEEINNFFSSAAIRELLDTHPENEVNAAAAVAETEIEQPLKPADSLAHEASNKAVEACDEQLQVKLPSNELAKNAEQNKNNEDICSAASDMDVPKDKITETNESIFMKEPENKVHTATEEIVTTPAYPSKPLLRVRTPADIAKLETLPFVSGNLFLSEPSSSHDVSSTKGNAAILRVVGVSGIAKTLRSQHKKQK